MCNVSRIFSRRARPVLAAVVSLLAVPRLRSEVATPSPPLSPPAPPALVARPAAKTLALPRLVVGKTTYHDVRVVSHDARSVFFTYRGGLGSARLRDLPAEVQAGLGYDPFNLPPEPPPKPPSPDAEPLPPERVVSANRRLEALFHAYGSPAALAPEVSLRDRFERLDLTVKFQGRRPSCSVYAIVSALEFQSFQLEGRAEDFSEEYLIWATRRSLGLDGRHGLPELDSRGEPVADIGFSLLAVARALADYGIALEAEMPSRIRTSLDPADAPAQTLIDLSRRRSAILIVPVPGRTSEEILNNLVHVLNAGIPVPAGMLWSNDDRARAGWLDQQSPVGGHAVTFVGYECPTGLREEAVFVFKNSYGKSWGQGGYGRATWRYLARNLSDAYVLDAYLIDPRAFRAEPER